MTLATRSLPWSRNGTPYIEYSTRDRSVLNQLRGAGRLDDGHTAGGLGLRSSGSPPTN